MPRDPQLCLFKTAMSVSVLLRCKRASMGNLYEEAGAAYRRAIEIRNASSDPKNPHLASDLNAQAEVMRQMREFSEAEKAGIRALGIQVRNSVSPKRRSRFWLFFSPELASTWARVAGNCRFCRGSMKVLLWDRTVVPESA